MQYKMLGGPAAAAAEEWVEQGEGPGPKPDPGTVRQRKIEFFKRYDDRRGRGKTGDQGGARSEPPARPMHDRHAACRPHARGRHAAGAPRNHGSAHPPPHLRRRRQLTGLLDRRRDEDGDEAELRPAWMAQLESAALQTLDELSAVQQELELLRHAAAADPEELAKQRAGRDAANAEILHSLRGTLQALQRGVES